MSAVVASVVAGDDAAAQAMPLQEMSHAIRRLECVVDKLDQGGYYRMLVKRCTSSQTAR